MRDYGKVYSSFWSSETTSTLSDTGRILACYLLSCQHGTLVGVFRLPDAYVAEDLGWGSERVSEGFAELFQKGFANRCGTSKWVWVRKHLEWNPLENPNQCKCARKIVEQIPELCQWKLDFLRVCGHHFGAEVPKDETLSEPLANPSETLSEPVSVTVSVTEVPPPTPQGGTAAAPEPKPKRKRQAERIQGYRPEVVGLVQRLLAQWPTSRDSRPIRHDLVDAVGAVEDLLDAHPEVTLDLLEAAALDWLQDPGDYPNAIQFWFGPGKNGKTPPWARAVKAEIYRRTNNPQPLPLEEVTV
jgi:hypothetical protein